MNRFLSSWTNFISLTFIGFVGVLFVVKLYTKIRSHFRISVNCWFCNQNAKVRYEQYNSWDCPHCGQYNGFKDDGDYNREIFGQFTNDRKQFVTQRVTGDEAYSLHNGFCQTCNDNQVTKVERLAEFEPDNEKSFAQELHTFRETLEETYRLCHRCEKNLSKVLAEKKKMVLGLRLAQKFDVIPAKIKQFTKPAHKYISAKKKLFRLVSTTLLFVLAITNWINVIGNLQINREILNTTYGPIVASIIFVVVTHLAALTKVLTKYCSSALQIHIVEKSLLFVRTIFALLSFTAGIDFHKQMANINMIVGNGTPFGCMFLAFGMNLLDGFVVTRTTYLLAVWSAYSTLLRDRLSEEYFIYKVLASLAILLLSLPSFEKTSELNRILDNTANSFHRIQSEDYLDDRSRTITTPIRYTKTASTLSKSSDRSNESISPSLLMGQSSCKTSSQFNLYSSPVSAFKSYSTEHLLPSKAGSIISDRYTFSPMSKSISTNGLNLNCNRNLPVSLHSPPRHDDTLHNTTIGCSTPNQSFVSCRAASTSSRQSLLSPSHFGGVARNNAIYCTAYAAQQQPSWVSGGFFNHDKPDNCKKNYFLNNITSNESISRGSSQSSGFESHTSSVQPGSGVGGAASSDRLFSRENSIGRGGGGDVDHLSVYSEPQQPLDLHNCSQSSVHNKSFEVPSLPSSQFVRRTNPFQSNVMDFESRDHWVRNSPVDFRRQAFQADYLGNLTIDCGTNSNPFDLNGMNSFLPPVRKRYNLLGSISEQQQQQHGSEHHFLTNTQ